MNNDPDKNGSDSVADEARRLREKYGNGQFPTITDERAKELTLELLRRAGCQNTQEVSFSKGPVAREGFSSLGRFSTYSAVAAVLGTNEDETIAFLRRTQRGYVLDIMVEGPNQAILGAIQFGITLGLAASTVSPEVEARANEEAKRGAQVAQLASDLILAEEAAKGGPGLVPLQTN